MAFPLLTFPFIGLHGEWGAQSVKLKIPYEYRKKTKAKQISQTHVETYSDNELDQTLFPKFIVLESTEDTPINKLSPFIIEKILSLVIKPKSIKKLANSKENLFRPSSRTEILL